MCQEWNRQKNFFSYKNIFVRMAYSWLTLCATITTTTMMQWTAQFLSTKRAVCYLFITFGRLITSWRWPASYGTHSVQRCTKLTALRHNSFWFMVAIGSRIARCSSSVVCGSEVRRPYRPWDTPYMKMFSSFINRLHNPSNYWNWTGF